MTGDFSDHLNEEQSNTVARHPAQTRIADFSVGHAWALLSRQARLLSDKPAVMTVQGRRLALLADSSKCRTIIAGTSSQIAYSTTLAATKPFARMSGPVACSICNHTVRIAKLAWYA